MGGLSMEWKHYKMDELIEEISMGPFGSDVKKEFYVDNGVPILNGSNLQGFKLQEDSFGYLTKEKADSLKKCNAHRGDIIVTHRGTLGQIVYVPVNSKYDRYVISQSQFRFRCKADLVDVQYLVYYFHTREGQYKILANASQVGVPALARATSTFRLIDIKLPSLKDQRRIASILSSLDRKIELNNKINADLEEMAQAIFKNWFVDFEPFKDGKFVDSELGMIPDGWKVISLSEIMKYNGGSQPPASEFIDTYQEGYIRFIQIRDYDNDSHITYIPISKRNKLCDELDIMIARYGAALGRICWGLKGAYNVALAKVTPIKSYYREYLRCYLNTSYFYQSINNKGARCAQSGFNQSDINSYMIAFPIDETVVMNFNDLCSSIMDKRLSLKYENSRLSLLRDTLLPRLMSGELEVPE